MNQYLLSLLDEERYHSGSASVEGDVIRELTFGGDECTITYSHTTERTVDAVICREVSYAIRAPYRLEWKTYSHDMPKMLRDRLVVAGFEAQPPEQVIYAPVSPSLLSDFDNRAMDIRKVRRPEELEAVAEISRQIGRLDAESERRRLAEILKASPQAMSVYVAFWGGTPVACGRVYFPEQSQFAEFAGGRTKIEYRRRGFYSALVGARIKEAMDRGRRYARIDALPTSEAIMMKRGFRNLTTTQPFIFDGKLANISP